MRQRSQTDTYLCFNILRSQMYIMLRPQIYGDKCDGCGLCVGVCSGLVLVDNIVTLVETTNCDWCTLCEAVCPRGAICCPYEIVINEC